LGRLVVVIVVIIVVVIVVLSSEEHVLDVAQAVDVVESVGHGDRDGRHGQDGTEKLRGPHVV